MLVRRQRPADLATVGAIHRAAFPTPVEAELAAALLLGDEVPHPALSLVCDDGGRLIGHVVCSRGWVHPTGAGDPVPALGLGPIGVLPAAQGAGIGSALMHAVLGAADALGEGLVALLGAPAYYRRFGFVTSTDVGVAAPDPAWGEHFQVRTLSTHDPSHQGRFTYAAPFGDVSS